MHGDAFVLVEDLDAAGGQARVDRGADETVGEGVTVQVDVDVIVDADPAYPPLAASSASPAGWRFRNGSPSRRRCD
jgi:hypothetical protein